MRRSVELDGPWSSTSPYEQTIRASTILLASSRPLPESRGRSRRCRRKRGDGHRNWAITIHTVLGFSPPAALFGLARAGRPLQQATGVASRGRHIAVAISSVACLSLSPPVPSLFLLPFCLAHLLKETLKLVVTRQAQGSSTCPSHVHCTA
jgi:hypothetical protein